MINLDTITLSKGKHTSPDKGISFIEAASMLANEEFSDEPACVSKSIAAFSRIANDNMEDDATRTKWLVPLIPVIVGTVGSVALERRRVFRIADWAVCDVTSMALDAAGLHDHATALRALKPIIDRTSCIAAYDAAYAADYTAYGAAGVADAAYAAYAADYAAYAADYTAYGAAGVADYAAGIVGKNIINQMSVDLIRELSGMKDREAA